MAQEIGVAYVTLLPSGKGFGKAVEGQVDQAVGKSEKKTDGFFSKLGSGVKKVALGIAGVATGVAALAIGGGISRALNIEDAQAKLKGLGHDTQSVETIMKDALASVKGTAFGLDAAATTAAAAVASGIKPGKELEGYLRLTADAATIAGVSMEEMGSIMNKVQAKGTASMEDLNRLTERGIPIMQMLADEYGVSAEEMSKMVSRGEVDSERFRAALEKNLGGAALESGNTTRGAFANMRAALSRLGLAFVGDGLSGAKTFFNEVTVILDGLTDRVGPWVEKFQDKLGGMFQIEGMGENFLTWLDETIDAVASGPIPQLLSALAPVLPALVELASVLGETLGQAMYELGEALGPALPEIAQALADAVVELAPSLVDLIGAVLPLIPPLVEMLAAIAPLAAEIINFLVPAISWLADLLGDEFEMVTTFFDYLAGDIDMNTVVEQLYTLGGPLGQLWQWLADSTIQFAFWASRVKLGVETAVVFVRSIPSRIMGALSGAGSWLVQTGRDMIQGLINGVSGMIQSAVNAVKNVGGAMLDGIQSFLGIKSPSRVFRDQVGKMVGLGLLEGIGDRSIQGRIDTAVNHLVSVPDGMPAGGRGDINQTNNFYEQQTDTRVFLRAAGRELRAAM